MPYSDRERRKEAQREAQRRKRERDTLGGENPILALRERLGLSRSDFSMMTGTRYADLVEVERGYKGRLPRAMLAALAILPGVDPIRLACEYDAWRYARGEALRRALLTQNPHSTPDPTGEAHGAGDSER